MTINCRMMFDTDYIRATLRRAETGEPVPSDERTEETIRFFREYQLPPHLRK